MLAEYRTPATAEELAMEVGVALTYADGQAMVAVIEGKSAEVDGAILKRL